MLKGDVAAFRGTKERPFMLVSLFLWRSTREMIWLILLIIALLLSVSIAVWNVCVCVCVCAWII